MKLRSLKLTRMLVLLGALAAATVPEAFAASAMKAHVPFAFVVANRVMPAGDYTVGCRQLQQRLGRSVRSW